MNVEAKPHLDGYGSSGKVPLIWLTAWKERFQPHYVYGHRQQQRPRRPRNVSRL